MREAISVCTIVLIVSMLFTIVASMEEDYFGYREIKPKKRHREDK